jgi:hypothetical protein
MKEVVSIVDFGRYSLNGSTVCHDPLADPSARQVQKTSEVPHLTTTFE